MTAHSEIADLLQVATSEALRADGHIQVGVAIPPGETEPAVILRLGAVLVVLEPASADMLGSALALEAAHARAMVSTDGPVQ